MSKRTKQPARTEPQSAWMQTVLLAANKAEVQEALDRLTPEDLLALDKAHIEARGDWRRKMIVDARRRLEREKAGSRDSEPGNRKKPGKKKRGCPVPAGGECLNAGDCKNCDTSGENDASDDAEEE